MWFITYFLVGKKNDIELYCVKCDSASRPTTVHKRATCRLCNASVIYQCKICIKRYAFLSSLYNHLKECNIEPRYKCSQCDYKSKRKGDLKKHVQTKHSINKCTQCDTIFKGSFALRKHQVNECVNEAMLKCNCCSFKTISNTQLMKHIRREHNSRYNICVLNAVRNT